MGKDGTGTRRGQQRELGGRGGRVLVLGRCPEPKRLGGRRAYHLVAWPA
jgi:hypothetical protein